jgi:hypothetical protein
MKLYTLSALQPSNIFLKFNLHYIYIYIDPVSAPHGIRSVNILNSSRLKLHKETIHIYRENRWEYIKFVNNMQMFQR